MQDLWSNKLAAKYTGNDLALRVYSSRLLGQEPALVLHGGGNTSVKSSVKNLFGEREELLYVKGSGWDLATIEAAGFAPVKLDALLKMANLPTLSDHAMVQTQRAAMTDPAAPNPSVEAILHALIPYKFVDHTHADAVVTISNTLDGEAYIRELYGERILIVPYVMPGFILARKIHEMCQEVDWQQLDGMVLMHHGLFTFSNNAADSYRQMIKLVSMAEEYLTAQHATVQPQPCSMVEDLPTLAEMRQAVSAVRGGAVVAQWERNDATVEFSKLPDLAALTGRGPLTPDHVIRTKRSPVLIDRKPQQAVDVYVERYHDYFQRNNKENLTCLNPAPCWAVWPGSGSISFGRSCKEAAIVADITTHTMPAIRSAELLGGWQPLTEGEIFAMEYWELEQAKLNRAQSELPLQGKIAVVTGAASGIGLACVSELQAQGAAVTALDLNPAPESQPPRQDTLWLSCDITDEQQLQRAVADTVRQFGGIDILISNAGAFFANETIEQMTAKSWEQSLAINLTSHQQLLQSCIPYLKLGVDPAVVMIASKNVPAPGPGAAAYSVAKAGQTQLARVAALELGGSGIRVNTIHPDAVFDTAIWTPEVLATRAQHYGLTVEQYKSKNILRRAVSSHNVAALACAMAGALFSCTTGAQIPVDGGNERVI